MEKQSAKLIENKILEKINNSKDLEVIYDMIELYGIIRSSSGGEPYQAEKLEKNLSELMINNYKLKGLTLDVIELKEKHAVIVTDLYTHGGHTRLLLQVIKSLNEERFDIFYSRSKNKYKIISDNIQNYFFADEKLSQLETIIWLVNKIRYYGRLTISIHPHDLVSAIAIRISKILNPKLELFFINHADHVFTFGLMNDMVSLEISRYGYNVQEKRGIFTNKSFIGIPIATYDNEFLENSSKSSAINMISSGSSFKFKPYGNINFPKTIGSILSLDKRIKFLIIGPSIASDWWWWIYKIRYPKRLSIMKRIEHKDYISCLRNSNVYIDSSPCTGGTAYSEAYGMGLVCIASSSIIYGYSPLDDFRLSDDKELIKEIHELVNKGFSSKSIKYPFYSEKINEYCSFLSFSARVKSSYEYKFNDCIYKHPKKLEEFYLGLRFGGVLLSDWVLNSKIDSVEFIIKIMLRKFTLIRIKDLISLCYGLVKRWI